MDQDGCDGRDDGDRSDDLRLPPVRAIVLALMGRRGRIRSQAEATVRVIDHGSASPEPDIDLPLRRLFQRPADAVARAVAWGLVRTFIGLLAAGLLVCYAYTSG